MIIKQNSVQEEDDKFEQDSWECKRQTSCKALFIFWLDHVSENSRMLTWDNIRSKQSVARSLILKYKYLFSSLCVLLLFLIHHKSLIINSLLLFFLVSFEMIFTKFLKRLSKSFVKTWYVIFMRFELWNSISWKHN